MSTRFPNLSSRDIIGQFWNRYEDVMGQELIEKIALLIESTRESETHRWLGANPVMREMIGGRVAKGLSEYALTIFNKPYEATLEISIDDLRREKHSQIKRQVNSLADGAAGHGGKLLSELILTGESAVCYDGQFFFDTDHQEGDSGVQSNIVEVDISALPVANHGSITAPSEEEIAKAIFKGIQRMFTFKNDRGEPINGTAKEFVVHTPVSLMDVAMAAVSTQKFANGKENTLLKAGFKLDVVADARSTWDDEFGIYRADGDGAPFINQVEVDTDLAVVAEGSELEFNERKHHYGVYQSRGVGFGLWQHAVLVRMI